MKSFNRNISIFLIILFVLVTSYATIDLLSLPTDILDAIGISENTKIEKAKEEAFSAYSVLIFDFFIVLLLIFMFSMNNVNHLADNIVYVEREVKSKESNASKNDKQESSLQESLHKFQSIKSSDFESEKEMYEKLLYFICNQVNASIGALYQTIEENKIKYQKFVTGYAFYVPESEVKKFEFGEGLVGQAAKSGKELIITDSIPEGYIKVSSGLGESDPKNLIIVPIKKDENVKGVLEIASFSKLDQDQINFLQSAAEILESSELAGKSEDKETTVEV